MRRAFVLLLFLTAFQAALAQEGFTTFILVRHAEKVQDGSKDPGLTPDGMVRAMSLSRMLGQTQVEAILSTPYARTQNTVAPLAASKALKIQSYDPSNFNYLDDAMLKYVGGTIVICGHSNTIPGAANYLLGKSDLKNFEDHEYDNILIVTLSTKGKGKLIRISY